MLKDRSLPYPPKLTASGWLTLTGQESHLLYVTTQARLLLQALQLYKRKRYLELVMDSCPRIVPDTGIN